MDIEILIALQDFRNGIGAFLAEFLAKMTFLCELNTVLVILAVVYWCISKDFGAYLLMGWSGSRIANGFMKVTACAYRPWIRDARIVPYGNAIETATGYSFPSGHTMNAAAVFGGVAVRKDMPRVLRTVLGSAVALVAFSRVYLGVHTPQDVLAGIAAGLLVMWLTTKLMRWIDAHPDKAWTIVLIGVGLAAAVAAYAALKPYPADFDAEGKLLADGAKMANDTFKAVGWCAAFLIGWALERKCVGFSTEVSVRTRVVRFVTGLLGYYAVSLILVPLLKGWINGPVGTAFSCFVQMFYICFFFPLCIKCFESQNDKKVRTGIIIAAVLLAAAVFAGAAAASKKTVGEVPLTAYWSPDSAAAQSLRDYIAKVTDPKDTENYIPKKDRIAVFDMDGTLACETYYTYYDTMMFIEYCLKDHPERVSDELKEIAAAIEPGYTADESLARNFAKAYAGMTMEEFYDYAVEFGRKETASFNNMRYIDNCYLPMVELVRYLYENDFTIYVISGTERTTTRAVVGNSPLKDYISPNHVIGTDFEVKQKGHETEASNMDFKYEEGDELVLTGGFIQKNLNANKAIFIQREIGQRPVLAFGNSGSDTSMMNYTIDSRNPYPAQAYMIVADDPFREWGTKDWEKASAEYTEKGYIPVSMRIDFAQIYPEEITKAAEQYQKIDWTQALQDAA